MPNREFCLDAVRDALYVSVADILSAFWQLPVVQGACRLHRLRDTERQVLF